MFTGMKLFLALSGRCKRYNVNITDFIYKIFSNRFSRESHHFNGIASGLTEKLESLKVSYEDGFTCYKLNVCAFCSSDQSHDPSELFINKKTGSFICHKCKVYGTWPMLDKFIQVNRSESQHDALDLSRESLSYDKTQEWQQIINDCVDFCNLDNAEGIMKDFNLSLCSKQDLNKLNVKINKEKNCLYFPIYCQGVVVGYRTWDLYENSSTFPKADCPGVLILNEEKKSSSVILVAGLRDFLALGCLKLSDHVVCLPYGLKTLPQNILPVLECYDKVIFWLGDQSGAWHTSIQFAKKLIEQRCYLIRPTVNQASAARAVASGEDVKNVISNAKPIWHQFVTTFSALREDVMAEIQNVREISGVPWLRFPQLTNILRGHRRGELTILTGPTGCGKTTFLSEYSLDLALQGVNTLWGSFELKNSRLARTMLQQYSGLCLTPDNMDLVKYWADKFETLPIYFLTFHGQHSINVVMNAVEHCSYTYDITHVLIDNIQFMMDISTDANKYLNRFWNQDLILQSFRKFATANNCHVTLVIHPRKEMEGTDLGMNSIFGTAKAAQEADNILILQYNQHNQAGSRKYLQVCKNRFSGDLGKMPLVFDKKTLRYSQKVKNNNNEENEKKSDGEQFRHFQLDENT